MNDSKKKTSKLELAIIIFVVVVVICLVVGATYAFWKIPFTQENENEMTVSCLDISYEENTPAIDLPGVYPMDEDLGRATKPFSFTLTNNCNQAVNYRVNLETLAGTTLSPDFLTAILDDEEELKKISEYTPAKKKDDETSLYSNELKTGTIPAGSNQTVTHELRIWMPSDVSNLATMKQTYHGKIVITATLD